VVHVLQTTQNLVILQRTAKKCAKTYNARAQPLLCSLNLLFSDVVFLNSMFLHSKLKQYAAFLLKKYFFILDMWIYRLRGFTPTLNKLHHLLCCQIQTQEESFKNPHLFFLAVATASPTDNLFLLTTSM